MYIKMKQSPLMDTKGMRKSVYLAGNILEAIMERYETDAVNYSEAINMAMTRYCAMVESELSQLQLSDAEWSLLTQAYKASNLRFRGKHGLLAPTGPMLAAMIANVSPGATPALKMKLNKMNLTQRIAVVDLIERYSMDE